MVTELLATLRDLDVKIWAEGDQIRVSTPRGTLQPELRQKIKEFKPELLAILRVSQSASVAARTQIPRISRDEPLALSSAQQRMWFLNQLEPDGSGYNIFVSNRIKEPFDVPAMERCLTELVARHETLRTNFRIEHGKPYQVIAPPAPWTLPVLDLQPLPAEERERRIAEVIAEQTSCPFDLADEPLLRTLVIRAGPQDFLFIMVMHHIISDAMSILVMQRELTALYDAFRAGQPSPLPPLPFQYADYAAWQQSTLDSPAMQNQLAYWKRKLAGPLPALELPTDERRSSSGHVSGSQAALLPSDFSAQLLAFAQREQTTLFTVILAAFDLLLSRLTGQDDILLGTPIAGRNQPGLEQLIGLFLNTLVLRTDLSGNPTFRELLRRVQETTLGAYSNQELPFERVVEEVQPERNLHRNPLFDVLINFFSHVETQVDAAAYSWELREANAQDSKLPITFYIEQMRDSIGLRMVYQQALFTPERMRGLLEQLEHLLRQAAANPDLPIGSYSLVTPAAKAIVPDPTRSLPQPVYEPAMQTLLRWARETPDQPALVQGSLCWSYGQLGERASDLAKTLLALGCRRGDVVAVTGFRSPALIAGMAAAMLSGGVLLTLDPALPPLRQQTMLREAKARWLLVFADRLPDDPPWSGTDLRVLLADPALGTVSNAPDAGDTGAIDLAAVELPAVDAGDPAYIFFTSGTTNVPKGVLGVHRGLSHFLNWQRTTFGVGPGDRSAQLTGLSFDVVLRDVFLPLTSGAALHLPNENYLVGSSRALQWMQDNAITVLHTVPGIVQTWLVDPPAGATLSAMRWVFFAGEPLSEALVQAWRTTFSESTNIVNLYGPTETTLAKFYYQTPPNLLVGVQPVGSPQPSTQALVLRADNQLCGIGEPGEIVIRTPFRSLGYINAPDEQVKRFVPNPFGSDANDLVYYTGDRGRYRPDGMLDILGRLDDQVKINGVRIELGELNAALLEHPQVKSGVVIARKNADQQYELVGYVVTDKDAPVSAADLRRHFADRFPAAMVPRSFVYLDKLPLNANGKVDRRALPAPAETADESADHDRVELPRDMTEARLLAIWRKLLKVERIGVNDDFFALGGYSMLAVRMFAQIHEEFGVQLPLTSLFKKATIEHLAALIQEQTGDTPWSSLVEMKVNGSKPPFFCVHGMTGDVFWFRDLVGHLDPEQPFWGLQSRGLDGIQEPLTSIEDMAAHYISEIRALQPQGPYYIGGYSFGGSIAYEMACQLEQAGQEVGLLAIIDHATPASGYYNYQVSGDFFYHFFRNLPYRVQDFLRRRPDQIWARIRRQFFAMYRAADRSLHREVKNPNFDAGELIDQAQDLPPQVQRVIETNFNAIRAYRPHAYGGKLTLLRARGERLFVTHDPEMGWGQYAHGGVDVREIPGSHLRLFHPSHVGHLASQLQQCLNEAQLVEQNG